MLEGVSIDRSTTAERVADALREKILAGGITPGTPLREVALGRSLGVARSTVREAMQLLTAEGLLTRSLYRGVVVTELSADDVADIYRARRLLEIGGVTSMYDGHDDDLAALRATIDRWRSSADRRDVAAIVDLHLAFHGQLVGLLRSHRLDALFTSLMADLRLALATVDRTIDNVDEHYASHQLLLGMLERREIGDCARDLEHHLGRAESSVLAHGRLRTSDG